MTQETETMQEGDAADDIVTATRKVMRNETKHSHTQQRKE